MDLPPTADREPLLSATKSVLKSTKISTLYDFCLKHNLVVTTSGKRRQSVKDDYVACILSYVSDFSKGKIQMELINSRPATRPPDT
jgi:hypothetical protein